MKNSIKTASCLTTLLLGTVTIANARVAAVLTPSATLTSTDGQFKVYEAASGNTVYYFLDIVSEPSAVQVNSFAVSLNTTTPASSIPNLFGGISSSLGANSGSGVFPKASWSTYSSVPFETAFGNTDNAFIYVKGTNAITTSNDLDGSSGLNEANYTAYRVGTAASDFVAFGPTGNILGSSQPIPEAATSVLCGLAAVGLALRRRR